MARVLTVESNRYPGRVGRGVRGRAAARPAGSAALSELGRESLAPVADGVDARELDGGGRHHQGRH